jgi:hypothetical protein
MAVRVTIEARDKQAAAVLAQRLGATAAPKTRRGLGVIRLVAKNASETARIVDQVSGLLEEHGDLGWVRVRYDDESRIFRSNGRRAS